MPQPRKNPEQRLSLNQYEKFRALDLLNIQRWTKQRIEQRFGMVIGSFDQVIHRDDLDAWLEHSKMDKFNMVINNSFQPKENDVTEAELLALDWSAIKYKTVKMELFKYEVNYITGLSRDYYKVRGIKKEL